MKKPILLYPLMFCLFISIWAGKPENPIQVKARAMEKNFVEVSPNLLAAKFEVSNIDYREFLAFQERQSAENANDLQIKSENWGKILAYADPVSKGYFSHPAFYNYPVVNVSHGSAQAYCNWLTELYHTDPKRKYQKVVFRLPTAEEWETAASGGNAENSYAWDGIYLRDKKGKYLCNFYMIPQHMLTLDENKKYSIGEDSKNGKWFHDYWMITAPVKSFAPNSFGLFNTCGNAAEMTSTEGIAKGGSWRDTGYDVRIQSEQTYEEASPKVGFRVFMEIVEE